MSRVRLARHSSHRVLVKVWEHFCRCFELQLFGTIVVLDNVLVECRHPHGAVELYLVCAVDMTLSNLLDDLSALLLHTLNPYGSCLELLLPSGSRVGPFAGSTDGAAVLGDVFGGVHASAKRRKRLTVNRLML